MTHCSPMSPQTELGGGDVRDRRPLAAVSPTWRACGALILMALFVLACGLANVVAGEGEERAVVGLVPIWLLPFCPGWALLLPRARLAIWWALTGALVFWLAQHLAAKLSEGWPFWPAGWAALGWAVGAGASVWALTRVFGPWPRVTREGPVGGGIPLWRAAVFGILMLLFIAAWEFAVGCVYYGPVLGGSTVACVWYWLVPFCPAWALVSPTRRMRLWWAVGGAMLFWFAELLRTGPGGGPLPWPTGWMAVIWAVLAGLLVWLLSWLFGPWSANGSADHSQPHEVSRRDGQPTDTP